jgi:short-subunit dehydrogenase
MKNLNYTVITGASRGLGKALAVECAIRKMNLILIALPGEDVFSLGVKLIGEYNVNVATYEADLTDSHSLKKVLGWINSKFNVNMLVNNAGIGGSNTFQEVSSVYIDSIMLLNIRALVLLTHGLLPNLKTSKKAYILNIASMASFGPMPFKTVYPASKAFVYSFSRGLYTELKSTGVFVSVAHPGGMRTNDSVTQRINQYSKLVQSTILSPEKTARICIRELLRNNSLIIPGFMNKVSWLFLKLCPVWLQLVIFRNSITKDLPLQKDIRYAC